MIPFKGVKPKIHDSAYIAMQSILTGQVTIGADSSVWFGTVLRADMNRIVIGERTNIQDNSTFHMDHKSAVLIGNNVTVGHNCIMHGCEVKDNVIIGMGSTVMDGAVINSRSIVGANSLITANKTFPEGVLIMGSPAKVIRDLRDDEIQSITDLADEYVELAKAYKN